jgi:epoxyqueuosine reductase
MSLTDQIRSIALDIGFSKIGFARAESLSEEQSQLEEWLRRRFHGSMSWMDRNKDKRVDPRKVLPGAKTVLSVALNYYVDIRRSSDANNGKISRYAWGDDYHTVMIVRLQRLLESVKSLQPEIEGKIYVDTGPVMEKVWASRAGIGWQGKHSNLITKDFGSWVFLGEIFLDRELEYDDPIGDWCGTCTACIEACPTNAITEPYIVDSNRCISYLTIEHKGAIETELSTKFENWVYGCDICQDVCPWNRFQQKTKEPAFSPRPWNINPSLDDLRKLDKEEFNKRFAKSPIKRAKREGLIRNARVVAGS